MGVKTPSEAKNSVYGLGLGIGGGLAIASLIELRNIKKQDKIDK